jgi:hypothetical protein
MSDPVRNVSFVSRVYRSARKKEGKTKIGEKIQDLFMRVAVLSSIVSFFDALPI